MASSTDGKSGLLLGKELILNGDFEDHRYAGATSGAFLYDSITGWQATVDKIEIQEKNYGAGNAAGDAVLELDANVNATVQQTVSVDEAGSFLLSLDYAPRGTNYGTNGFEVLVNGVVVKSINPNAPGFKTLALELDLAAGDNVIAFRGTGASDCLGTVIDDVSLRAICDHEKIGENLIVNGDFEDHRYAGATSGAFRYDSITGWTALVDKVEIQEKDYGTGNKAGNGVLDVDANVNATVEQKVNISDAGVYRLSLDYAQRGTDASTNGFEILINGEVQKTVHTDGQGFKSLSIDLDLDAGVNSIALRGIGKSDCYGTVIDNVALRAVTCADDCDHEVLGQNLIINGDFEDNRIINNGKSGWAQYESITGWTAVVDKIEIHTQDYGTGNKYGNSVVELDGVGNATVQQTVNITDGGTYRLELDYAQRGNDASTNGFEILVNGEVYKTVHTDGRGFESIAIDFDLDAGQNTIAFRGIGKADCMGTVIDNISLRSVTCDKGTASLGDTVWFDTNRNGVLDNGETGASGVKVTLTGAGDDGVLGTSDDTMAMTTTDANGKYLFDNLFAGDYKVTFGGKDGYDFTTQSNVPAENVNNDSDAGANGMTDKITLSVGEHERDIDAGLVKLQTASLGDTVWFDDNRNGVLDNGETGASGVKVTLTGAGNDGVLGTSDDTMAMTTTDANGKYLFDNLEAGDYKVTFGGKTGYTFTTASNVPAENVNNDSDAGAGGMTDKITLSVGEHERDIDAGLVKLNDGPNATNDTGHLCADTATALDVLANDTDADNDALSITAINGTAVNAGGSVTLASGAVVTLNADGTLGYDLSGQDDFDNLLIGDKATDSFVYTIDDGNGGSANANVDVTVCGAKNTLETIEASLPDQVVYTPTYSGFTSEYYDVSVTSSDGRIAGFHAEAYCLEAFDEVSFGNNVPANLLLSSENLPSNTIEGSEENLDLVNWILNQDYRGQGYDAEDIQLAIWNLTDGRQTSDAGALEIINQAQTNGEGFVAGEGDLVGLVLAPLNQDEQAFIITVAYDDLKQSCLCDENINNVL